MKKFLSMFLTLILVLNIFVSTGMIAFATEGSEECTHTDGGDNYDNICDNCAEYIGTDELALGENSVMMTDFYEDTKRLIKFVPEESGLYEFYSTGTDKDPRGYLYDSTLSQITYNDDTTWLPYNRAFGFVEELVAGETYYLSVSSSGMNGTELVEHTVAVAKHNGHTDGDDYYNNLCDKCTAYLLDYDFELGEREVTIPTDKYFFGRFIPENDGMYKFSVYDTDDSMDIYAYNEYLNSIEFTTKEIANGIELAAELTAGETYYLVLDNYSDVEVTKTVKIETHTHSGGVQTCKGYLCDCGFYYGEGVTEHRLDTTQTCQGYECIDCGIFFGEANDNHTWVSSIQTCKGYRCNDCFEYIGEKGEHKLGDTQYCAGYKCSDCYEFFNEGTGEHIDDNSDNMCDVCKAYIGDEVIVLGENTVPSTSDIIYIPFTPSESGRYHIYSTANDGNDTLAYLYDSELSHIDLDLSSGEGDNFLLKVDLTAGETYYLGLCNYNIIDETYTVIVETHQHSDGEQYCKGYLCDDCNEYYGEGNDNHNWDFGICIICYSYCEHTGTSETQTCAGYLCECGLYYGEGNDDHVDGNDNYNNLCDGCNKYVGTVDVVLGENTVSLKNGSFTYLSFIPSESGIYKIYSQSEYDPKITIYDDVGMNENSYIGESDDDNDRNFILYVELTAGTTYYFELHEYEHDNDLTYFVEKHEHIPNCLGECGGCGISLDTVGEHMDGEDEYNNFCDDCGLYIGKEVVSVGKNTIFLNDNKFTYLSFIPSESGIYKIYSQSEYDPKITIYDDLKMDEDSFVGESDDDNEYNFILYVQLTAGTTYYFALYEYESDNDLTYFVEKHEHSMTLTCIGYVCECGEIDDSEVDEDAHIWYYGCCKYHEDVFYPDDIECSHNWVSGTCNICGDSHDCTEFDDNGVCVVCDYQKYDVVVITNGETAFYDTFEEALETAVDGSIIKLLDDAWSEGVDINQSITIDLNGHELFAATLYSINVYAPITLTDSYGGGYCELGINLYAPAVLEGGGYRYISIEFETEDNIRDYLAPCAYFDYFDIWDNKYIDGAIILLKHNEKQICTGIICTDCGQKFEGEAAPDVHSFADYEICEDATCVSNAKECSTCEWCEEATDVREIEDTKEPHSFKPLYGEGYIVCECGEKVYSKIYSGDAARAVSAAVTRTLSQNIYNIVKDLVVGLLDEYLGFLVEDFNNFMNN